MYRKLTRVDVPMVQVGSAIPKIIRQTFATKNLPVVIADGIAAMMQMNPGYRHEFYDDDEVVAYIKRYFGERVVSAYDRIHPAYGAARADLFRYLVMYREGGIYLDIKSTTVQPLDSVIRQDDRYLLAQWENAPGEEYERVGLSPELRDVPRGEYQQWHLITVAGHPFLRAVIERVINNIESYRPWTGRVGRVGVLRTTGPRAYTRTIRGLLSRHPHRLVRSQRDIGLKYSVYGDFRAHRVLSTSYYRNSTKPVVRNAGVLAPAYWLYSLRERRRALRTRSAGTEQ